MRIFTAHPRSVGESYTEHFGVATRFGTRMMVAGAACFLHGIFPFMFTKTGSNAVRELHERMVTNRHRQQPPVSAALPSAQPGE